MATQANNRPKLDLILNKPVTVKILKDKPFEGSSSYGTYVLYSIEHEGTEKAFFATPEAHEILSRLPLKVGDEVLLKKVAFQNGNRVGSRVSVEHISKVTTQAPNPAPVSVPIKSEQGMADNLKVVMERSLQEAVDITRSVQGVPFQNEDIQKIASCLFIARTKGNGFQLQG
jgi:hypothetical protein